jgi:hypothetical protein
MEGFMTLSERVPFVNGGNWKKEDGRCLFCKVSASCAKCEGFEREEPSLMERRVFFGKASVSCAPWECLRRNTI